MVSQFTFNLYFLLLHVDLLKKYMYIVDVNKDVSSAFLFCVLRPAKHKTRWGHSLQGAHFERCSHYFMENTSWSCKLSMKASKLFRKYPKTPDFDHSNYWLFERIPAAPGTLNNRGLTVQYFLEIITCNSTIYIVDYPYFTVLNFMENSIVLKTVKQRRCSKTYMPSEIPFQQLH